MFGSGILETAIGLVFVFLLVSMLVTIVNELISAMLLSRAKWLRLGIERLLDSEWATKLYDHPLIDGSAAVSATGKAVSSLRGAGPSYIPSRSFANVLMDLLRETSGADNGSMNAIQLRLQAVLDKASGDSAPFELLKNEMAALKSEFPNSRLAAAAATDLERLVPRLQSALAALPALPDGAVDRLPATYTVRNAMADLQRFVDSMPARRVREMILNVKNERIRKTLLVLFDDAQNDVERFKQNVEVWFNNAMDRVGGWYKRRSQWVMLGISVVAAVSLNVDSVLIVKHLQTYPGVRDALVAQAKGYADSAPATLVRRTASQAAGQAGAMTPAAAQAAIINTAMPANGAAAATPDPSVDLPAQFSAVQAQLTQLSLPMGWVKKSASTQADRDAMLEAPDPDSEHFTKDLMNVLTFHLLGWLITALAATLGAPFWFDTLNRIMSIRSAGKAPEEMPKPPKEVPLPLEPGQSPADAGFHARS